MWRELAHRGEEIGGNRGENNFECFVKFFNEIFCKKFENISSKNSKKLIKSKKVIKNWKKNFR